MKIPNIFSFATSELSQDAFLCWLLSWAAPNLIKIDPMLHKAATEFISFMFEKSSKETPKIDTIEIHKQKYNIDILCVINNKIAIIIEDKTWTKNHSDQLNRYINEVVKSGFSLENIIPIYLKTQDQASYSDIIKSNYKVVTRQDLITIMNGTEYDSIDNAIFNDFKHHLIHIEDKVNSYLTLPISQWGWHSWIGFYMRLQKELNTGHWDYVANPSGGFLGFWWSFQGNNECEQYLQLEEHKLCVKISVDDKVDKSEERHKWFTKALTKSKELELNFAKPSRFGSGSYMTILVADQEYRKTDANGIIDLDNTLKNLRNAENLLSVI